MPGDVWMKTLCLFGIYAWNTLFLLMTDIEPKWQKQILTLYDKNSKGVKDICSHGTSLDRPEYSDVDKTKVNATSTLRLAL